jgi:kinesin family protein 2/24
VEAFKGAKATCFAYG